MVDWVIKKTGSSSNNGAKLITDGYFYSHLHINTSIGELYLDLNTKICKTNIQGVFNIKFENTRDNSVLFKGEHKTTATILWKDNNNILSINIDFFENPQIRNGIRMNTVLTNNNPIGLLVDDYEPSFLRVKNSKNKISKYYDLVKTLETGKKVNGDILNLQKNNELWTRHYQ